MSSAWLVDVEGGYKGVRRDVVNLAIWEHFSRHKRGCKLLSSLSNQFLKSANCLWGWTACLLGLREFDGEWTAKRLHVCCVVCVGKEEDKPDSPKRLETCFPTPAVDIIIPTSEPRVIDAV